MKTKPLILSPWFLFGVCAVTWSVIALKGMAPEFASDDVYLFRDAASNSLLGHGFTTFAVERQTSFAPHLYTSYTPGLQWVYIGFARVFGNSPRSESAFVLCCTFLLDAVFFLIGLRFSGKGRIRALFLGLLAVLFPMAGLAIMPDRPEYISLLLLTWVLYLLSKPLGWNRAALLGFLSCAAFLVEPIAGAFAVFFVIGAFLASLFRRSGVASSNLCPLSIAKVALIVGLFAAGIAGLAAIAAHLDSRSLSRFNEQARMGGLQRTHESRQGDFDWPPHPDGSALRPVSGTHGKLWDIGYSFAASRGAIYQSLGYMACFLLFIWILRISTGPFIGRLALLVLGAVCLVMPLAFFPLQENYRMMTVPLLALALAYNWAGTGTAANMRQAPVLILLLFFAGCAPSVVSSYAIRIENRNSYHAAVQQARSLRAYLESHKGIESGVFIVPDSHYYLYKDIVGAMTTPRYLFQKEDPALVDGVINCYDGTQFFKPSILPLPELVSKLRFRRILSEDLDVPISVPMLIRKSNETWECDVYVRN